MGSGPITGQTARTPEGGLALVALAFSGLELASAALEVFGFLAIHVPHLSGFVIAHDLDLWAAAIGALGLIPGLLGPVLGFVALRLAKKKGTSVPMARWAVVVGLAALCLAALAYVGGGFWSGAWRL
jgi:hypothetical protein